MAMLGSLMSNPMLMMGLGMLGQAGPSRNPTNAATGAMQGLQMGQQAQMQQQQMLWMQQLMQQKKAEEERKRQQQQMMPQLMGAFMNPDPDMAEETRGQALSGMMGLDPSMAKSILPSMVQPVKQTGFMQDVEWLTSLPEDDPMRELGIKLKTRPSMSVTMQTEKQQDVGMLADIMAYSSHLLTELPEASPIDVELTKSAFTNWMASPEGQSAAASQKAWTAAIIQMQSGAAATDAEVDRGWKTYWPQPGDTAEAKRTKAKLRARRETSAFKRAGTERPEFATSSPPPGFVED